MSEQTVYPEAVPASPPPRATDPAQADGLSGPSPALPSAQPNPLDELAPKLSGPPVGVKVSLNLDTLERETPEDPYWFQLEGEYFQLLAADEADWQDLAVGQDNPRLLLHVLMTDDDQRTRFFSKKLPVRKLKALVEDYTKHFGLTPPGEPGGSAQS